MVGRERFGLSTFRLSAERSNQTELSALQMVDQYEILLSPLKEFSARNGKAAFI